MTPTPRPLLDTLVKVLLWVQIVAMSLYLVAYLYLAARHILPMRWQLAAAVAAFIGVNVWLLIQKRNARRSRAGTEMLPH